MPINIDLEELIVGMKSNGYETEFFLNRDTGTIAVLSDGNFCDEDVDVEIEDGDEIVAVGNYINVPQVPSHDAFIVMQEYIETLPEGIEQVRLADAINGGKPFRRFKDILSDYPELRDQWFKFEKCAYRKIIERWIADDGIDAVLVDRFAD
jgi:hypothetical protein